MDAVEYLKERCRMTQNCNIACLNCPLDRNNNGRDMECSDLESRCPKTAISIVEQWSREHPKKTRQSEFLKHYPDAKIEDGIIRICPKMMKKDFNLHLCGNNQEICRKCRSNYWLAEIVEDPEDEE